MPIAFEVVYTCGPIHNRHEVLSDSNNYFTFGAFHLNYSSCSPHLPSPKYKSTASKNLSQLRCKLLAWRKVSQAGYYITNPKRPVSWEIWTMIVQSFFPSVTAKLPAISRPSPKCNSSNSKSSVPEDLNSDCAVPPVSHHWMTWHFKTISWLWLCSSPSVTPVNDLTFQDYLLIIILPTQRTLLGIHQHWMCRVSSPLPSCSGLPSQDIFQV